MFISSSETVILSLLSSSVVATAISLSAGNYLEKRRWMRDKKMEEWREVLGAVNDFSLAASRQGESPFRDFHFPLLNYRNQRANVLRILRSRIFIAPPLASREASSALHALLQAADQGSDVLCESATVNDILRKMSRDDLGLASDGE